MIRSPSCTPCANPTWCALAPPAQPPPPSFPCPTIKHPPDRDVTFRNPVPGDPERDFSRQLTFPRVRRASFTRKTSSRRPGTIFSRERGLPGDPEGDFRQKISFPSLPKAIDAHERRFQSLLLAITSMTTANTGAIQLEVSQGQVRCIGEASDSKPAGHVTRERMQGTGRSYDRGPLVWGRRQQGNRGTWRSGIGILPRAPGADGQLVPGGVILTGAPRMPRRGQRIT